MRNRIQVMGIALAGVLIVLASPAAAQIQVGDNINMKANGVVSGGYSANYGNLIDSSHSMNVGGSGTLTGSYYNPNFLSFSLSPYLNQSRANSNFQSISNSSGFNFNSGIFSGSHFPGSINYAKAYSSQGNFGIPNVADFTTHGNSDTFGINWSENLPDAPSFSAGFQMGSSGYSIYGTNDHGSSAFHSLTLRSGYRVAGWGLSAFYDNGTSHSTIPQVFSTSPEPLQTDSGNNGFGVNASHALPLHGGTSINFSRSNFDTHDAGVRYQGTIDTINANAGIQPTSKLHLSLSTNYSDNLTGTLFQAVVASGGIIPPVQNQESHATEVLGVASYSISKSMQAQGDVERRAQYFEGKNFSATALGGGLSYTHPLMGGYINGSVSLRDNRIDNSNTNTLGLSSSLNYSRRISEWYLSGSFTYAQNQQTLLVSYTTSFYNYSGSVRRRFGRLTWSGSAAGSRTGLTAVAGSESHSESFSTGLAYGRWISANSAYASSHGTAIQTSGGLTTTPVPIPVVPTGLQILYGGQSESFGLGTSPVKRLTIGSSYSKATGDTSISGAGSWNKNEQISTYYQYQFRKVNLTGGYAKLTQSFSASGTPPANVSSFYFGISRWFDFF